MFTCFDNGSQEKKMWVKFVWYSLNCFLEKFKFDMKFFLVLLNYSWSIIASSSPYLFFLISFFNGIITANSSEVWPVCALPTRGLNFTLCPPKVTSVRLLLPTSVKKKGKSIFLHHFYVSLLPKHKTHKNSIENKIKMCYW